MRIIAYRTSTQNGRVLLQESTGEYVLDNDIEKLFAFLLEDYGECIKVCWDLDATVSVFLKLLGVKLCRDLRTTKRCWVNDYKVFYIPGKVFSITYGRYKMSLYGLEQYYPELAEPDVEEVQGLGMGLLEELKKMGLRPDKLTSPVAVYEQTVLKDLDLPLAKDMPVAVAEMAWLCSGRLWIESHQIGYFK